jgi:hypothetical protein
LEPPSNPGRFTSITSGKTFSVGDTLQGKFTYDPTTSISNTFSGCCGEVAYLEDSKQNTISFVDEANGSVYTSGVTIPTTLIMANYVTTGANREGSMTAINLTYSPSSREVAVLTIADRSGNSLGTTLPPSLNFQNREEWFSYSWMRLSDNSEVQVGGIISSFAESSAEVPEPGSIFLLSVGLAYLVVIRGGKSKKC